MMGLESLLRAARDGQPGAWAQLNKILSPQLRSYFKRWYPFEDAMDLTQTTLLVLFEVRHDFEPHSSFEGWIFGVARNVGRGAEREQERRAALHDALDQNPPHSPTSLSSALCREELLEIALEELRELPEHLQAVIEHDLAEDEPEEIAAQHGINRVTVRTRRNRAHKRLGDQVADRCRTPIPPEVRKRTAACRTPISG